MSLMRSVMPMQCPNFNSLRVVSFSAAVMSLSYSTIAIGGAIAIGKQPNAYYNLDRFSTADKVSKTCPTVRLQGAGLIWCVEVSALSLWLYVSGPATDGLESAVHSLCSAVGRHSCCWSTKSAGLAGLL